MRKLGRWNEDIVLTEGETTIRGLTDVGYVVIRAKKLRGVSQRLTYNIYRHVERVAVKGKKGKKEMM